MTGAALRVLMLEDQPSDAALIERELRHAGIKFQLIRTDRREPFTRALEEFAADIVLVDYTLPDFDGISAVRLVRSRSADLPVILVTGALRDEAALEVIEAGANDYVLKERLVQLPFAVRRSLLQAGENRARRRAERALRTLSGGNQALVHADEEATLLEEMCRVVVEKGGYRMAWIGIAEHDETKTVRPAACAGHDDGYTARARVRWDESEQGHGPTGTAIRTGEVQVNQDFASNPSLAPWRADALERGFASSIALPITDRTGVFGALTIYAAEPEAFDGAEQELLSELATDLSYGVAALRDRLERDAGAKRLQRSMESTIEALASTVEARDPYTAGHQRRVAKLAASIAREMRLPEDRIHAIYLAGIVHDVGKIHFPAEILMKPGPLTPIERALIETHAQLGYDILKGIDFPWPIAQAVLQHHERLDGSGYPNRLRGDAIILDARILAVADVVEAMTSQRPHRQPAARAAAVQEIEKGRGRLYDPDVAGACLEIHRSGRLVLE
jgi:putative nucleotidyltransferase with HDIG domain